MARRGENIYKRKDGRYEGRYIKGYNIDGKAEYSSVYARSYYEVKSKLSNAKGNSKEHETVKPLSISVAEWTEKWLFSIKNTVKPSTYALYTGYLENHIRPYFKFIVLHKLNVEALQGFINLKLSEGLAVSTVKAIFTFMKPALIDAYKNHYLLENIICKIKIPKTPQKEVNAFSLDEQKRLEIAIKNASKNVYIGILICLYTGIRIGELCGLKWSDIDFEKNIMHIRRTMQRIKNDNEKDRKTKIIFMLPKSRSSYRKIPLPTFLIKLLKRYKPETGNSNDFILTREGQPIEPRNMQYQFKSLLIRANIKKTNFHVLRHTFATRALENGFDVKTLSEILGHASATVTLNKYAHSMDDFKRSRMEVLGAIYQ